MSNKSVESIINQKLVPASGVKQDDAAAQSDVVTSLTPEELDAVAGGLLAYGDYYPPKTA